MGKKRKEFMVLPYVLRENLPEVLEKLDYDGYDIVSVLPARYTDDMVAIVAQREFEPAWHPDF